MSKYADIEQIKKIIRSEWVKYMPSDLDINLSFVLGKIAEVPTIEVNEDCDNCIWNTCNYNKVPWEVSEDCISRADLRMSLARPLENNNADEMYWKGWHDCTVAVETRIADAPSVVPSRAEGEWIYINNPLRLDDEWKCSRCGNISFEKTNFCDRCGAKMKGADDD